MGKICPRCNHFKDEQQFHKSLKRTDGLQPYCIVCCKEKRDPNESKKHWSKNQEKEKLRKKIFYENNKEQVNQTNMKYRSQHPEQTKKYRAKGKYKLSYEEFDKLMLINHCSICLSGLTIAKHKHIDHCHKTGKVRGILCAKCNIGLGHFNDSISNLQNAIKYLENNG